MFHLFLNRKISIHFHNCDVCVDVVVGGAGVGAGAGTGVIYQLLQLKPQITNNSESF